MNAAGVSGRQVRPGDAHEGSPARWFASLHGRFALALLLLVGAFAVGSLATEALFPTMPVGLKVLLGAVVFLLLAAPLVWLQALAPMRREFVRSLGEQSSRTAAAEERLRTHENDARLQHALEIAEDEGGVLRIAEQALKRVSETGGAQIMMAPNPDGEIDHSSVIGVMDPAAECVIRSPRECPTVRRGQGAVYEDGLALSACRGLRGEIDAGCAAACVPVFIAGRGTGMIRALGSAGDPSLYRQLQQLTFHAHQIGSRLGVMRSVAASEVKATTDPLTGLFNRRALDARLGVLIEQQAPFALIIADIDHFKRINDTHGHDVGDRALKVLAATLKQCVRRHDLVCRFGGEEFVVLLVGLDVAGALEIIERVRSELPRATARASVPTFTLSAGIVDHGEADDADALLRTADQLLYEAKSLGRDRVQMAPGRPVHEAPVAPAQG
ncbi:MAG: GGDEF domain-containing protein [Burkholderiales bacterium]|nr:GGDEF domain-containing protein [Burkholderiales bacterium]